MTEDEKKVALDHENYTDVIDFKLVKLKDTGEVKFIVNDVKTGDVLKPTDKVNVVFGLTMDYIENHLPYQLGFFLNTPEGQAMLKEGKKKADQAKRPKLEIVK